MLLSQQQPQPAAPPPGMFAGISLRAGKRGPRKNFSKSGVCGRKFYPQVLRTSKENAPQYDEQASGATVGRYISSDPIGLRGGDLNTFSYVWQNPVMGIDADGLSGIKAIKWLVSAGKRLGFVTTGTISFKSGIRLRKLQKDCQVVGNNAKERRKLAKEIERRANPNGELIEHGKDAHVNSGNQPHFQTKGKKGHTFYDLASVFAATTYLGHGFLGEAVDFFNPLSIPKDLADLYNEFSDDDDGNDENCGCMVQ